MVESIAPKVSIVVPMYNVEKYVGFCLDSLLAQSLEDIEIIAVDDGSPDSSGAIAEDYSRRDHRVRVVHRENGGLGSARNTGIECATGEYIGFVDSDDWVDESMFSDLYRAASEWGADIVRGGYEVWSNGKLVARKPHPLAGKVLQGRDEIEPFRMLLYGRMPEDSEPLPLPVEVWTSIYKRDLVQDSGVRFRDILSEDTFFNIGVCKYAQRIAYIGECGYRYRKDGQPSITNSFNPRTVDRYLGLARQLLFQAEDEECAQEARLRCGRKIIDLARTLAFQVAKSNLTMNQKCQVLNNFIFSEEFAEHSRNYPTHGLPIYQALTHQLLVKGRYRIVLALMMVRNSLRGEQ